MAGRRSRKILGALALSAAFGWPFQALAAEGAPGETSEAAKKMAAKKYEEGVVAYRNGRYADAVRLFLGADSLRPSAALSFDIALACERQGDEAAALRWYRSYLRLLPEASNRAEVRQRVDELSRLLAAKGIQQITVLSDPPGATVDVDGRAVGVTPLTFELSPGAHDALVTARGYADAQRHFVLAALTPQDLTFTLTKDRVAGAPASPAPAAPDERVHRRFGIVPFVTIGVGVVALGGALGFELSRRSAEDAARNEQQQLAFERDIHAMNDRQAASRILLGTGAALAVTGTVLLFLNDPVTPQMHTAVLAVPGGAELSLSRGF